MTPSPGPLPAVAEPLFEVRSELRRVAHLLDDLKYDEASEVLEEAVVQLGELLLVCRAAACGAEPGLARLESALFGASVVVTSRAPVTPGLGERPCLTRPGGPPAGTDPDSFADQPLW